MAPPPKNLKRRLIVMSDDEDEDNQQPLPKKLKQPRQGDDVSDEEVFRVFYVLWIWTNRACPDTVTKRVNIVEEYSLSANMRYMPYPVATQMIEYLNDVNIDFFLVGYLSRLSSIQLRDELRAMLQCVEGTSSLLNIVGVPTLIKKIREKPWYRKLNEWTSELEVLNQQRYADPVSRREGRADWSLADQFSQSGKRGGAPVKSPVWRLAGERMPEGDTAMGRREWNVGWGSRIFLQPHNFIPFIRNGYLQDWDDVPIAIRTDPTVLAALVQRPPPMQFESIGALRRWFRTEVSEEMLEMLKPFVKQT